MAAKYLPKLENERPYPWVGSPVCVFQRLRDLRSRVGAIEPVLEFSVPGGTSGLTGGHPGSLCKPVAVLSNLICTDVQVGLGFLLQPLHRLSVTHGPQPRSNASVTRTVCLRTRPMDLASHVWPLQWASDAGKGWIVQAYDTLFMSICQWNKFPTWASLRDSCNIAA